MNLGLEVYLFNIHSEETWLVLLMHTSKYIVITLHEEGRPVLVVYCLTYLHSQDR